MHVSVELIGLPLLNALQQKPNLIIVRDKLFLRMNVGQEIPTIFMLKEDEPLFRQGISVKSLNSPDSSRPSVKICTSDQFAPRLEEFVQKLQPIFSDRNLMEPFDRLDKACEDVHSRKLGEGSR